MVKTRPCWLPALFIAIVCGTIAIYLSVVVSREPRTIASPIGEFISISNPDGSQSVEFVDFLAPRGKHKIVGMALHREVSGDTISYLHIVTNDLRTVHEIDPYRQMMRRFAARLMESATTDLERKRAAEIQRCADLPTPPDEK